jgi:hypothetical protein
LAGFERTEVDVREDGRGLESRPVTGVAGAGIVAEAFASGGPIRATLDVGSFTNVFWTSMPAPKATAPSASATRELRNVGLRDGYDHSSSGPDGCAGGVGADGRIELSINANDGFVSASARSGFAMRSASDVRSTSAR